MKKLLLLIICALTASMHPMESEERKVSTKTHKKSKEKTPREDPLSHLVARYEKLIDSRDWVAISKMYGLDRLMAPNDAVALIGMAKAQQNIDTIILNDAVQKQFDPRTDLEKAKGFYKASTVTFELISHMFTRYIGKE
jgi:hypothetical protein